MSILDSKVAASLVLCMSVPPRGARISSRKGPECARWSVRKVAAIPCPNEPQQVYLFGPSELRDEAKAVHWFEASGAKNHGPRGIPVGMVLLSNKNDSAKNTGRRETISRGPLRAVAPVPPDFSETCSLPRPRVIPTIE